MEKNTAGETILQNLTDAGCDEDMLRRFCEMAGRAELDPCARREQIRLLCGYRKRLLDELHTCQKKLDCLDYLLFRLKEGLEDGSACAGCMCDKPDTGAEERHE